VLRGKTVSSVTVRAKVTRADGTVEDLGVISHSDYRHPLRRAWGKVCNILGGGVNVKQRCR